MADVLFNGGPCDGQKGDADPAQVGTGTILCEGINYHLFLLSTDNYLALLPGARPPSEAALAAPTMVGVPDDANIAWRDFNRAFGRKLPEAVNRTTTLRRAIRDVGRR